MGRQVLLGVVFVLVAGAAPQGQGPTTTDLAGEWVLAIERYGEMQYQRMTLQVTGDQVTAVSPGLQLEGVIRNQRLELKRRGAGSSVAMTGTWTPGEMSGELAVGDLPGHWKATRPRQRPSNAPREHTFEPTQFPRVYSAGITPALHIYPGDGVRTWTVDAGGRDSKGVRRSLGGNPLTGPFYVEGAMPGDTLVVKLTRVRLNRETAFSGTSIPNIAITPEYLLSQKSIATYLTDWLLDRQNGVGRLAKPTDALRDFTVPLRPMLGCIGVAPSPRQVFPSGQQGNQYGGNMDYNRIREGVTLYLPVNVPGALLLIGDGHAAQGDGELTGNALETSMDVEFAVELIRDKRLQGPRAEDGEYVMAMGFSRSLTEALTYATEQMALWLQNEYALSTAEAALVMGTVLQYDIAAVVGVNVNVVAKVPKTSIASLRKPGA